MRLHEDPRWLDPKYHASFDDKVYAGALGLFEGIRTPCIEAFAVAFEEDRDLDYQMSIHPDVLALPKDDPLFQHICNLPTYAEYLNNTACWVGFHSYSHYLCALKRFDAMKPYFYSGCINLFDPMFVNVGEDNDIDYYPDSADCFDDERTDLEREIIKEFNSCEQV